ncbi:hypothetical protein JNUCC1_03320 [Lentibacillus sp. JNUCC-1]|uniref:hypothetical protein n=1 Tax=Lentibacillus sp. JNUCC-1 TaxID=2654513 RepID=UPI0012E99146|nr:hypothetical protein [Lentibacillus sp. JNUCC-1]MUV39442.1 hypothetical protein [Lentibacillus sp. JNUCC-1]
MDSYTNKKLTADTVSSQINEYRTSIPHNPLTGNLTLQATIYDFLDDIDPVYEKLSSLKLDQEVTFKTIKVTHNQFGFYEVETAEEHEVFPCVISSYYHICELIGGEIRESISGSG